MKQNLWIRHRKITRHFYDKDRGMERAWDPDLGMGKHVGYRSYEPDVVVLYTEEEMNLLEQHTTQSLIRLRIDAGLTQADLDVRLGVAVGKVNRWERNGCVPRSETRWAWINVCREAAEELHAWTALDPQVARVKADLTISRVAQLVGAAERNVRLWDLGGCDDPDVRTRWAAVCRNAYVRNQREVEVIDGE